MNNQIEPLSHFQVVAIHRDTGVPQFASVTAPSQAEADDFVGDVQPEWIIIREAEASECDHCGEIFPTKELNPCAVEPDFLFCDDCADKLRG
jgi:hypothetical protein